MASAPPRAAKATDDPRGTFTLSLDFELAWGSFYRRPVDGERQLAARRAVPTLLGELDRARIRATVAVVGHLLLEGCDGRHDDMPRPQVAWREGDWYHGDPGGDERSEPAWYAPSLVRQIARAAPGHDIGGHGFSHVPLDDAGVSPAVARAEIRAVARLLRAEGYAGTSFVFPRNGLKYPQFLKDEGFACYRGVERGWVQGDLKPLRKLSHFFDQVLGRAPGVGQPRLVGSMVEAPSSMLFWSREGFRRHLPMATRVRRARKGIAAAVRTGSVFHLWLHVEDLVPETDKMMAGLAAVLGEVARRVERGELVNRTMAELIAPVQDRG